MKVSSGDTAFKVLTNYLLNAMLGHFHDVNSVVMHGSAARNEITLYSDTNEEILLGNIGLTIITESPRKNALPYFMLLSRLENIDKSKLGMFLEKPLILLKPFEITLISRHKIKQIPPTITTFEMVKAHQILYGKDLLSQFNVLFGLEEGLRMIINRLVGLNLCLPLIARSDYNSRLKILAINYECTKGVLGALEAFLVLLGKYVPTYRERAHLVSEVVNEFSETFDDAEAREIFNQACQLKLNPNGLERFHPAEYWLKARSLLGLALHTYRSRGISLKDVFVAQHEESRFLGFNFKSFLGFAVNKAFDPRIFLVRKDFKEAIVKLVLKCVFSFKPKDYNKKSTINKLILNSRYANYIYTYGQWREIMDHVKTIEAKG